MAGGDVRIRLQPGQEMPVTTPGDYIYLKQADRDIRVTITEGSGVQKPVVMTAGDKYRPGPFRALNIANTSSTRPAQIVMVIGEGDFNRQIVTGEIVVDPRVKTADGSFVSDQREEHRLTVTMDYKFQPAAVAGVGNLLVDRPQPAGDGWGLAREGELFKFDGHSGGDLILHTMTPDGDIISRTVANPQIGDPTVRGVGYIGNGQWIMCNADEEIYIFSETTNGLTSADRQPDMEAFIAERTPYEARVFNTAPNGDIYALIEEPTTGKGVFNLTKREYLFSSEQIMGYDTKAIAVVDENRVILLGGNDSQYHDVRRQENGEWVLDGGAPKPLDLSGAGAVTGAGINGAFYDPRTRRVYFMMQRSADIKVISFSVDEYEAGDLHAGTATETDICLPGLVNRANQGDRSSLADIRVQWVNGKAYATGEVIKFILDLFGIDTTGEYMDSITGFEAKTRERRVSLQLGGRTFMADGIPDYFENVEFPQTVTITALNRLWR